MRNPMLSVGLLVLALALPAAAHAESGVSGFFERLFGPEQRNQPKRAPPSTKSPDDATLNRNRRAPAQTSRPAGPTRSGLVIEAQSRLNALGYDAGPVDGLMGGRTRNAIREFQQAAGLAVDGEVSDGLIEALRQGSATPPAETPTSPTAAATPPAAAASPSAPPPEAYARLVAGGDGFKPIALAFRQGVPALGAGLTDVEGGEAFIRFLRRVALGTAPAAFAMSWVAHMAAMQMLTEAAWKPYACPPIGGGGGCVGLDSLDPWRGRNEAEARASLEAFRTEMRPRFAAGLPARPFDVIVVDSGRLGRYDAKRGGIAIPVDEELAGQARVVDIAFTPNFKLPALLELPQSEAEALLDKLNKRMGYLALRLRVDAVTVLEESELDRFRLETSPVSIGLYADPELTQLVHQIFGEAPEVEVAATPAVLPAAATPPALAPAPDYCAEALAAGGPAWLPAAGTAGRAEAEAACHAGPAAAYGPDMLDLRLGMPFDEAVRLAGDYLEAPLDAAAAEPRPFQRARLGWSRDASQGIALFALPASDAWRLAGIARRLYFADPAAAPDRAAVLASLREKYGKEVWRDGERAFVWAASGSGKVCGGVAELIDERPGWTPDWPPGGRLPVAPAADEAWTGFAAHAACGPVLVALLNGEQGGPLADAAFAVFDPAWIAAQPGFAFAAAPAQGAKRKKRRIDF